MDELITAMCLGETVTASLMLARLITFFRLSRCLCESSTHRLQAFSLEKPWIFGFAEVKQSPPSRE